MEKNNKGDDEVDYLDGVEPEVQVGSSQSMPAGRSTVHYLFGKDRADKGLTEEEERIAASYSAKKRDAASAQADASRWKTAAGVSVAFAVAVCGVMLALVIAGNELSKDTKPAAHGSTAELRMTNAEKSLVEAGSVAAFSTLLDLPKQSQSFLAKLERVTYAVDGYVATAQITRYEWYSASSMILYLSAGTEKLVIGADSAKLHAAGGRVVQIIPGEKKNAELRRRMLASLGVDVAEGTNVVRALSRADLQQVARSLAGSPDEADRRLASSEELFLGMYRAFGGIIEANVSAQDANESDALGKAQDDDMPTPIDLHTRSKWVLSMEASVSSGDEHVEHWYLDFDEKSKQMRFRTETHKDGGGTIAVTEMHMGGKESKIFRYMLVDTDMYEGATAEHLSYTVESLNGTGTTPEAMLKVHKEQLLAIAVDEQSSSCTVETIQTSQGQDSEAPQDRRLAEAPQDSDGPPDGDASGIEIEAAYLFSNEPGEGAVWQVGGYLIRADTTGKPTEILELVDEKSDILKRVATVDSIAELSEQEADEKLSGCVPADAMDDKIARRRRALHEVDSGDFSPEEVVARQLLDSVLASVDAAPGKEERDEAARRRLWSATDYFNYMTTWTHWCGIHTDEWNTPCPTHWYVVGYDQFYGDNACRRHDHAARQWHVPGTSWSTIHSCDVDRDLAWASWWWPIQALYGRYGLIQLCYDKEHYYVTRYRWRHTCSWGGYWTGEWMWSGYWWYQWRWVWVWRCSWRHEAYSAYAGMREVRKWGRSRYDSIQHTFGYYTRRKPCAEDSWGKGFF